jgi:uncharacterized protein
MDNIRKGAGVKQTLLWITGWVFMGLGVLGLFLPLLPGVVFLIVGLTILSSRSQRISRLLHRLENRYPRHYGQVAHWQGRIKRWFRL